MQIRLQRYKKISNYDTRIKNYFVTLHAEFERRIMKRLLFGALALSVLMFSCKGKQAEGVAQDAPQDTTRLAAQDTMATDTLEQLIAETPMPRAADELFDDFLFNFAANSRLQMERVAFPLRVIRNGDTTRVDKSKWKRERFFMHQDFYTVIFDGEKQMELVRDTSVSEAVVEKIYFNTGAVLQYQFKRIKGAWMLLEVRTEPIASPQYLQSLVSSCLINTFTFLQLGQVQK